MTRYDKAYFKNIGSLLEQIIENESDLMEKTANLFSEVIKQNGRIFVSGSGHSSLVAQEAYYRAGGLVSIKPIWLKSLLITENAEMSTHLERISGIAEATLNEYQPNQKDCLVIVSNSGRNAYGIELALVAKSMRCTTVALTSIQHSSSVESRHSSGKRLFELCDIVIDSHVPLGDASMSHQDFKEHFGPVSTISTVAIFNAVVCRTIEILLENKHYPKVLESANL